MKNLNYMKDVLQYICMKNASNTPFNTHF